MKNLFLCITACLLFTCCGKERRDLSKVEIFIETLKADKTERLEAPDFDVDNISELLKYRNERLNTANFARNPLSSFYLEEVTIGMYVLWTIESLRMEAIDDPNFYLFASLNPRILRAGSSEMIDQDMVLAEVAEAYFEWWNSSLSSEEKLRIDPLEGSDLNWN